jgi:PAS domain S-box-containing protein
MTQDDRFRERIDDVRARVLELQEQAIETHPDPTLLDKMLKDLSTTLEELDVAEEELREQSEVLEETRNELVREQERYEQLFEFAPDAYIVTDLHGGIQDANRTAVQLLNLEAQFLTRKPLVVFIAQEQRQTFREVMTNLHNAGSVPAQEFVLQPRGKLDPLVVIATTTLIYDAVGNPVAIHWALVDISEQKRLEDELRAISIALGERDADRTKELEAAVEQKDQLLVREQAARAEAERANLLKMKLLATISHELRTPLTSIKGFASTLLAKDVTWEMDRWHDFVTIIDDEANKLTELVDQLLDLSRLQAGALRIHLEPRPLMRAVEVAMPQLQTLTSEHHLTLDVPDDLPRVSIDQWRIAQVLVNLVGNAAKYSPSGTSIGISAHAHDEVVEVHVVDEGAGIPVAEREQVFDAFYQSEGQILKRPGAGLGLAICKGLIEEHQGKIWIAKRDQPGTTVCFTLPVVAS